MRHVHLYLRIKLLKQSANNAANAMSHVENHSFRRVLSAGQYNKNTLHRQKQQNEGKLDRIIKQNRADWR